MCDDEKSHDSTDRWQRSRDLSLGYKDSIYSTLKANGGRMSKVDLMKATGLGSNAIINCCKEWKSYFALERHGWRQTVKFVQIHRHILENANG